MGTGFEPNIAEENVGIIPRAVDYLFERIAFDIDEAKSTGKPLPVHALSVTFLELYNEEMYNLLGVGSIDRVSFFYIGMETSCAMRNI